MAQTNTIASKLTYSPAKHKTMVVKTIHAQETLPPQPKTVLKLERFRPKCWLGRKAAYHEEEDLI